VQHQLLPLCVQEWCDNPRFSEGCSGPFPSGVVNEVRVRARERERGSWREKKGESNVVQRMTLCQEMCELMISYVSDRDLAWNCWIGGWSRELRNKLQNLGFIFVADCCVTQVCSLFKMDEVRMEKQKRSTLGEKKT